MESFHGFAVLCIHVHAHSAVCLRPSAHESSNAVVPQQNDQLYATLSTESQNMQLRLHARPSRPLHCLCSKCGYARLLAHRGWHSGTRCSRLGNMEASDSESDGGVPILPLNASEGLDDETILHPAPPCSESEANARESAVTVAVAGSSPLLETGPPPVAAEPFEPAPESGLYSSKETNFRRSLSSGALEGLRSRNQTLELFQQSIRNQLLLQRATQRATPDSLHTRERPDNAEPSSSSGPEHETNLHGALTTNERDLCRDSGRAEDSPVSERGQGALPSSAENVSPEHRDSHDEEFPQLPTLRPSGRARGQAPEPIATTPYAGFGQHTPAEQKKPKRALNTLLCFRFGFNGHATVEKITTTEILAAARANDQIRAPSSANCIPADSQSEETLHHAVWRQRKKERRKLQAELRGILQSRDLRQIHPTTKPRPVILVRRHVIIVSLAHLRAVIFADHMLLFNPNDQSVRQSARSIEERLIAAQSDEEQEIPFELHALESVLIEVCVALERDLACIEPSLTRLLNELTHKISGRKLEEMLYLKQMLSNFSSRVDGVRDALQDLLSEDEDMARMYLTEMRKHPDTERPTKAHTQVEELLESYLRVLDYLAGRARLLGATIDDTEGLVDLQLDSMRNRLLRISVLMTVLTCVFSGAGVVNRFFSMNLQLPIYGTNASWFIGFVAITAFTVPLTILCMFWWARRVGILTV